MKKALVIIRSLAICAVILFVQAAARAQAGAVTREDVGRAAEAQKLEAEVRESFSQTKARVGAAVPYLSLTVAARRLDAAVAVGSPAIGSDDPVIAAGGADVELVIQPVRWPGAGSARAETVGEPMVVKMGAYDNGASASAPGREGRRPAHALNFICPAPVEADGVRVTAKVIAAGGETTEFDFTLELRGEPTAGTTVYTDYKREAARLARRR